MTAMPRAWVVPLTTGELMTMFRQGSMREPRNLSVYDTTAMPSSPVRSVVGLLTCPLLAPALIWIPSARVSRTVTRSSRKLLTWPTNTPTDAEPVIVMSLRVTPARDHQFVLIRIVIAWAAQRCGEVQVAQRNIVGRDPYRRREVVRGLQRCAIPVDSSARHTDIDNAAVLVCAGIQRERLAGPELIELSLQGCRTVIGRGALGDLLPPKRARR